MFRAEICKNVRLFFLSEIFHFLVVKFSLYLNRHVFAMCTKLLNMCIIIEVRIQEDYNRETNVEGSEKKVG